MAELNVDVGRSLTQELQKARLDAGDEGSQSAAAAPGAADVFNGDPLLDALQACAHQLVRLRDTLLAQVKWGGSMWSIPT